MRDEAADVLVIGSGIAGLTFALKAARFASVLLVTKKARAESNTNYARGGIAAVLGPDDDTSLHVEDTLVAGAGLCHRDAVDTLVAEGPSRVRELIEWGTAFRRTPDGRLSLGREGGHSRRRIAHAGDRTGIAIESALLQAVEDEPAIRVLEDHLAVDLLLGAEPTTHGPVCRGVLALDHRNGRRVVLRARATLLATGGCGQVYLHTTNPAIATGDGVAMAFRAGARIANMEFIQFHPTALHPTEDPAFLISEAVRGEGAILRRTDGTAFMERYHPLASLAPRDVVARAIHQELRTTGDVHALLDVGAIPPPEMERRFPDTVEGLRRRGIEPHETGIPVVPAAHYVCGGVVTDPRARTSLRGLWAAGEVACTGVHGANRLASNSLLEAVVFSHRAAKCVAEVLAGPEPERGGEWLPGGLPVEDRSRPAVDSGGEATGGEATGGGSGGGDAAAQGDEAEEAEQAEDPQEAEDLLAGEARERVRSLMWSHAGIVRRRTELDEAAGELATLRGEWERHWRAEPWTPHRLEIRNLVTCAELIVASARAREESRGLHHVVDHPHRNNEDFLLDSLVQRGEGDV